jgi:hypothetical protein
LDGWPTLFLAAAMLNIMCIFMAVKYTTTDRLDEAKLSKRD